MDESELCRRITELEQEVEALRRYVAAMQESKQLGPIVIVPSSLDPGVMQDVQIVCP